MHSSLQLHGVCQGMVLMATTVVYTCINVLKWWIVASIEKGGSAGAQLRDRDQVLSPYNRTCPSMDLVASAVIILMKAVKKKIWNNNVLKLKWDWVRRDQVYICFNY